MKKVLSRVCVAMFYERRRQHFCDWKEASWTSSFWVGLARVAGLVLSFNELIRTNRRRCTNSYYKMPTVVDRSCKYWWTKFWNLWAWENTERTRGRQARWHQLGAILKKNSLNAKNKFLVIQLTPREVSNGTNCAMESVMCRGKRGTRHAECRLVRMHLNVTM